MHVLIMLLALAYVAGKAGDSVMQTIAFAVVGAVLGFFVWNFPVARSADGVRSATRSPTSAHQRGTGATLGPHSRGNHAVRVVSKWRFTGCAHT